MPGNEPARTLLGEAIRQHQAGQLDQAEQLYRRILADVSADAASHKAALANLAAAHRWIDQDFLRLEISPQVREQIMIHDSCHDLFGARSFPLAGRLTAPGHVGAGYPLADNADP
jgi:hypothetical protein